MRAEIRDDLPLAQKFEPNIYRVNNTANPIITNRISFSPTASTASSQPRHGERQPIAQSENECLVSGELAPHDGELSSCFCIYCE
jgi:hypothetical protein